MSFKKALNNVMKKGGKKPSPKPIDAVKSSNKKSGKKGC